MDGGAYRDDDEQEQPGTYWRRRAITLVAGLALLGLLAWIFSGGGGTPSGLTAASSSPAVSDGSAPEPPAAASASAGADAAVPGLPTSSASATGAAPAAAPSGGGCSPGSVVLSLVSTRSSYSARQFPEFTVYAVSTAPGSCTLNLGPSQLYLTVMSAGRVIWDSADCSRGRAGLDDQLSRGVPAQTSITWNRTVTLPGCVTLASSARPGTYQAQVRTATAASQVRTFTLTS